ncbi:MAG: hypothetical protein ABI638_06235 [Ignavibacteriota bacterium]
MVRQNAATRSTNDAKQTIAVAIAKKCEPKYRSPIRVNRTTGKLAIDKVQVRTIINAQRSPSTAGEAA